MTIRGRGTYGAAMVLTALGVLAAACSTKATDNGYTCGPGTKPVGSQCVVSNEDASAPSDASGDAVNCAAKAMLYPDMDGDGFGAELEAAILLCVGTAGYAGNNLDCADGDARAHPGQTMFFKTAIVGASSKQPYDFNCDGMMELEITAVEPCSSGMHPPGWDPAPPQCGASGIFNQSACEEMTRVQGCR